MKSLKKLAVLGLGLVGATSLLASCGDDKGYNIEGIDSKVDVSAIDFVQDGKLTVGMSTDFAPMEFIDTTKTGQDKFVGADVTFSKALAQAFDLELEIKAMDFNVVLTALNTNTIDLAISGYSYTAERAASYAPSLMYYEEGDGGQVIIVKKDDLSKYSTLESLKKSEVKVAAQTGSLQDFLVTEQLQGCTKVLITNLDEALTKLEAGAVDAVACAKSTAETKVALNDNIAIAAEEFDAAGYEGNFAWAKKGNDELITAVNIVIDEVVKEDLFQNWMDDANALYLNLGSKAEEIIPEEDEDETTGE